MIPEIEKIRDAKAVDFNDPANYKMGFNDAYAATIKHLAGSEGDAEKFYHELSFMVLGSTGYYIQKTEYGSMSDDDVLQKFKDFLTAHTAQLLLKVQELEAENKSKEEKLDYFRYRYNDNY